MDSTVPILMFLGILILMFLGFNVGSLIAGVVFLFLIFFYLFEAIDNKMKGYHKK